MKPEELGQTVAVSALKEPLQHQYEDAYPQLSDIIHLVLDDEEAHARELTPFPLLLLPDLVEAHIETLGLEPVSTSHEEEAFTAPTYWPRLARAM